MRLQDHLLKIWEYDRPTLLLVTHDVEEALVLSDRVVVLGSRPGRSRSTCPAPVIAPIRLSRPAKPTCSKRWLLTRNFRTLHNHYK